MPSETETRRFDDGARIRRLESALATFRLDRQKVSRRIQRRALAWLALAALAGGALVWGAAYLWLAVLPVASDTKTLDWLPPGMLIPAKGVIYADGQHWEGFEYQGREVFVLMSRGHAYQIGHTVFVLNQQDRPEKIAPAKIDCSRFYCVDCDSEKIEPVCKVTP